MIEIVHGGQTGVDRGAHEAATDNGWPIRGYMPKNGRDELGLIPDAVAQHLRRCTIPGYAERTEVNLRMLGEYKGPRLLLVVVPDKTDPYATPGTRLTLVKAREFGVPRLVVDPEDRTTPIVNAIRLHRVRGARADITVMVAGPRASRWTDGRIVTAALLRRLKLDLFDQGIQ